MKYKMSIELIIPEEIGEYYNIFDIINESLSRSSFKYTIYNHVEYSEIDLNRLKFEQIFGENELWELKYEI